LLASYPDALPLVFEVGGRVPRDADHHVNRETGEACLFVPDERWKVAPPGMTFLDLLNGPVRNFLLGQSLFRLTGEWPFGQRSHAAAGIREYYSELLGTDDVNVIVRYVECLSRATLKGHWPCPCGSGKRLRDCHRAQVDELRTKIPSAVALRSFESLRRAVSTNSPS
jgi:SEC-C motif